MLHRWAPRARQLLIVVGSAGLLALVSAASAVAGGSVPPFPK